MTRRELRALLAQKEAEEQGRTAPASTDPAANARANEVPVVTPRWQSASAPTPAKAETPAAAETPAKAPTSAKTETSAKTPTTAKAPSPPQVTPIAARPAAKPATPQPDTQATTAAEPPTTTGAIGTRPSMLPLPDATASVSLHTETLESDPADAGLQISPVRHWSDADESDDDVSRDVVSSGSVTTTNALILPSVPDHSVITGALTETGEILITGSIDLPRSLGATGHHSNQFDGADMDRLFEEEQMEAQQSDVAPVRASRAVSSHTATRDVITPPTSKGSRLPMVLAIVAAALAVGVIGVLVGGYVMGLF